MIIGFTNGCFDLFHNGHKHLLKQASLRCELLYVAINSSRSVMNLKGNGRPVDHEATRLDNVIRYLNAIGAPNRIALFDDDSALEVMIRQVKPTFIFKGEEYEGKPIVGVRAIDAWMPHPVLIPILPGISTTKLIEARSGIGHR